ncbi:MAG: hypothetical protein AB8B66_06420 [Rickettsiaceae bacterium]
MKKIYQIIKLPFAVYNFVEAWDLLARGKSHEAEKKFAQGEKYVDNLMYEFLIMKGMIKFNLHKDAECIVLFKKAWKQIDKDTKLPKEDKLYFKSYMSGCLEVYKEYLNYDFKPIEFIPIESIDLQKVNKNLKNRFPYRNHPDWDKYEG